MSDGYHLDDDLHERAYDGRIMRRLLRSVWPYRRSLSVATALLVAAALLGNLTPLLTMRAIDHYIDNPTRKALERGAPLPDAAPDPTQNIFEHIEALILRDSRGLETLVLIIAAIMLAEMLARYIQTFIVAYAGQITMFNMRMDIFVHLQKMSLAFLDRNPVGRLMTRVTTDVEKIQQTIVTGMVQVVSDLMTIVAVLGFMFYVNWKLTLITLSTTPLVFLSSAIFRKYARESYREISRKVARLNAYMQEIISGIRVVQIFGRESEAFEQYRTRNADHRDEWFRQVRYYAVYFPVVDFLGQLSIALILGYIGYQLLGAQAGASTTATVGLFMAFAQWADRLFGPIRALSDKYNMLQEAMASAERIFKLLDTPEDVADAPDAIPCATPKGEVEFRDVWFAYEDQQWVLKNLNFHINPGERIAIVGHTGAGKSTVINLLSRFYDVNRGAVLFDGHDVREYEQETLRRRIGVVLQDVFLFSGSIEDNIRLGDQAMTMEHIRECAEYVNAAGFIEALPGGYGYDVGERGGNLSTGQRQLIAFARALAHNPAVLVLDEATSSIDTLTEQLIQDAIVRLMESRTSIVIAHRLSTIQHADRILVFHHGELRESGTHQELLARKGLYHTLYELQYK